MFKIFVSVLTAVFFTSPLAKATEALNTMLKAYEQANYKIARKLAEKNCSRPEALMIKGLCIMFDNESPDYRQGMQILKKVYADKTCPCRFRMKAGLTLARCAQLFQERQEVYGKLGAKVKIDQIYNRVIAADPQSLDAVSAGMFLFEKNVNSAAEKTRRKAFMQMEKFCRNFKGSKRYLVPLRLLAQNRYIALEKDFKSAARHLAAAYHAGISNPRERECYLYQIARIYDLKLNDRENALKLYKEYLEKYPSSEFTNRITKLKNKLERKDM